MSYLDSYMSGSPSYSVGNGPLDIYKFIQDGYETGAAQAKTQRIAQLAQQAYGQTGGARNATVQQAIGVDPQAGYQIADVGIQQDAQAAALKQQKLAKIGQAATFILQAKQQGNDAAAQGAYQAIVPLLQSLDPSTPLPPTLDAAHMGNIYKLAAMAGGSLPAQPKPISVAAGTTLIDPNTHQQVYTSPERPIFDPTTGTLINKGTGTATPITMGGAAPTNTPSSTSNAPAAGKKVSFNFAPGTPPEVIAAAQAAARANGDLAPSVGQTLADYKASHAQAKAPSGYKFNADGSLSAIPGGPADKGQGGDTAPTLGDPTKSGADYLASLDPASRTIVQSYINGHQAVPTGTALKNPQLRSLVTAAYHADPDLEAGTYSSRVKTRQAFTSATSLNSPASQIRTLNTASGHLNQLLGDVMQLNNGSSNLVNAPVNIVESKFGNEKYTNLKADLTPVVSEVASLYKGGQATDAEIKSMMDSFPVNGSKAQQISVIERWIGLLHSKLGALDTQYSQGMGSMAAPLVTVSPQASAALQNITNTYKTLGLPLPSTVGEAATSAGGDAQPANPDIDALLKKYGGQ